FLLVNESKGDFQMRGGWGMHSHPYRCCETPPSRSIDENQNIPAPAGEKTPLALKDGIGFQLSVDQNCSTGPQLPLALHRDNLRPRVNGLKVVPPRFEQVWETRPTGKVAQAALPAPDASRAPRIKPFHCAQW